MTIVGTVCASGLAIHVIYVYFQSAMPLAWMVTCSCKITIVHIDYGDFPIFAASGPKRPKRGQSGAKEAGIKRTTRRMRERAGVCDVVQDQHEAVAA